MTSHSAGTTSTFLQLRRGREGRGGGAVALRKHLHMVSTTHYTYIKLKLGREAWAMYTRGSGYPMALGPLGPRGLAGRKGSGSETRNARSALSSVAATVDWHCSAARTHGRTPHQHQPLPATPSRQLTTDSSERSALGPPRLASPRLAAHAPLSRPPRSPPSPATSRRARRPPASVRLGSAATRTAPPYALHPLHSPRERERGFRP